MARRNSTSSTASARARDDRTPPPHANPNVFDDEYALDPDDDDFMPVSDGFRPAADATAHRRHDHDHDRTASPPRPSFSTAQSAEGGLRRLASRNSAVKAPFVRESISHDPRNPGTHHSRALNSQGTAALQRHESISSAGSFATMAPSEGAFGPSHPYNMYPQNTVARSSSVTTSSTQQQAQRPTSLRGPTHPYAMYPQNVIEDGPPPPPVQSAIPVGFPGLNTGYHRQIGPDGEEQDIVGPDGHTEQLPPYSRYPTEGPTKAALAAEASSAPFAAPIAPPVPAPPTASPPSSPSSPLSPAQPWPPLQQEADDRIAPEPPSPQANTTAAAPPLATQPAISEKQDLERSDGKWRSKKVCGIIPRGVAITIVVLLVIFAVVAGSAIGTFVAKNKHKGDGAEHTLGKDRDKPEPSPQLTGPTNTLFDATPIPTPSSMGSLPTGSFAVPLGIAQESSKNCLTVVDQLSAWSCKMTFAPLVLSINYTDSEPKAFLEGLPRPGGSIQYGIQPPQLTMRPLQLVLDMDNRLLGPAYHFSASYDKLVVLSQDEFVAGADIARALRTREDAPTYRHRFKVMPGDSPWYCHWKETYIEGYIYVDSNSTAATFTNFPTAQPSNTHGPSVPAETGSPATATDSAVSTPAPAESTPPSTPLLRRGDDFERRPPYPRFVKIEDRRLPDSPQAYCQQMQLLDDGNMVPALDIWDSPIKIDLQENNPTLEEFLAPEPTTSSSSDHRRANLKARDDPAEACHCQWMFQ